MEKNNGRKWTIIAFAFVCVAITGLTIAFASLATELNISSEAYVKGNKWEVKFENVTLGDIVGGAEEIGTSLNVTDTTISGIKAKLRLPGDSLSYTFDVVNLGSINAKIGNIVMPTLSSSNCTGISQETGTEDAAIVCGNIVYTLKYSGTDAAAGTTPAQFDTLAKKDTDNFRRQMTLTIAYKSDATEIPADDVEVEGLTIAITYVQD